MFGENVKWRRKMLGMTQAQLAGKIRLRYRRPTASFISRIESGELDPRLSTIRSLARALHTRPWILVADILEHPQFWEGYLSLSPAQKREIQRRIDWMLERK